MTRWERAERLRRYLDGGQTNHGLCPGMSAGDVTVIGPKVTRRAPYGIGPAGGLG